MVTSSQPDQPVKRFTLKLKEIPIELEDKDGNVGTFTLRDIDGAERDAFLNTMAQRYRYDGEGKPVNIKDFNAYQSSLITRCLFDPAGKAVPVNELQKWPAQVLSQLFDMLQELVGMDAKAVEKAKNA